MGDFKGSIDGAEETDKSDAWGRYAYRTTSHYRREITPELVSARNAAKRTYGPASPRWSTSPVQEDHAHGFCPSMCVSTRPMICGQLDVILAAAAIAVFR